MLIPPGLPPEEIVSVLEMLAEMDQDTREAWRKTGRTMLELVGKRPASPKTKRARALPLKRRTPKQHS